MVNEFMTATEITQLRRQGKLKEALEAVEQQRRDNPGDYAIACAAAWVYYAIIKQNKDNLNEVNKNLQNIAQLQLPAKENIIYESIVWAIYNVLDSVKKQQNTLPQIKQTLTLLNQLPINRQHESYYALLNAATKQEDPQTLLTIVKWWDLNNLRQQDYQPTQYNGEQLMPLAEKTYYAQAKAILNNTNDTVITVYLPLLIQRQQKHPQYTYLTYYITKMQNKIGLHQQALETLKPFAKKKNSEFWIWTLIAEMQDNEDDKMPYYCKALTCHTKDEMAINMNRTIGQYMLQNQQTQTGKYLIEKAVATYRRHPEWKIPQELIHLLNSAEYQQIQPQLNTQYIQQQAQKAEEYLYGQLTTTKAIIYNINTEKSIIDIITENQQTKNIRTNRKNKYTIGQLISITHPAENTGKKINALQITPINEPDNNLFYKPFSGKIKIINDQCGFVENIYIPQHLLTNLTYGETIQGIAHRSYDRKKDSLTWQALKIK